LDLADSELADAISPLTLPNMAASNYLLHALDASDMLSSDADEAPDGGPEDKALSHKKQTQPKSLPTRHGCSNVNR